MRLRWACCQLQVSLSATRVTLAWAIRALFSISAVGIGRKVRFFSISFVLFYCLHQLFIFRFLTTACNSKHVGLRRVWTVLTVTYPKTLKPQTPAMRTSPELNKCSFIVDTTLSSRPTATDNLLSLCSQPSSLKEGTDWPVVGPLLSPSSCNCSVQ